MYDDPMHWLMQNEPREYEAYLREKERARKSFFEENGYYNFEDKEPYQSFTYDDSPLPNEKSAAQSYGAIIWTEAGQHIGETVTICGAVKSIYHSAYQATQATYYPELGVSAPTFIAIGADYNNPSSVRVVIWYRNRKNFPTPPEVLYSGKTVCVTGSPYLYKGSVSIEVSSPSQIEIIDSTNQRNGVDSTEASILSQEQIVDWLERDENKIPW